MLGPDRVHVDLVERLPHTLERSVGVPRDALGVEHEGVAIVLVVVNPPSADGERVLVGQ